MQKLKNNIHELHLELTGKCNLQCHYCYNYAARDMEEMSLSDLYLLFEECKRYGTKLFTLTGGEPFMREDIWAIFSMLRGQYVAVLTNGMLINDWVLEKLKGYPMVKEFKISLDGFESNDLLRVGSNHKQLIKLIGKLKKRGYRVVINTIVLEENQRDLWKLYNTLLKHKVDRWRVDMPFLTGNYKDNCDRYRPPNPEIYTKQFARIITHYEKTKQKMALEIFNLYKSEFRPTNTIVWSGKCHPCEYKRELLSMKANGNVIFCPSMDFTMSNFPKAGYKLANVFKEEAQHSFYKLRVNDLLECKGCRYLKVCGGGCRCNPLYEFSDMGKRDTSACYTFPFWEKEILPVLKKSHQRFFKRLLDKQGFIPRSEVRP